MYEDSEELNLGRYGWERVDSALPEQMLDAARSALFSDGLAGERCLLDRPLVIEITRQVQFRLIQGRYLDPSACAIQAISFDKTPGANWNVSWHQDLMFPFAAPVTTAGYDLPTLKNGIAYARPPVSVLENLLAVRLHLDENNLNNGPLRVSPGTHQLGLIPAKETREVVEKCGEETCLANSGDLILMKPLLLHSSSKALEAKHRRVLHLVFYSGVPIQEKWHRAI